MICQALFTIFSKCFCKKNKGVQGISPVRLLILHKQRVDRRHKAVHGCGLRRAQFADLIIRQAVVLRQSEQLVGRLYGSKLYIRAGVLPGFIRRAVNASVNGSEVTRLLLAYGFQVKKWHRIELRVLEYNHRAIRCYEKCGFKDGVLRENAYIEGKYCSDIVMSILEREYKQGQKAMGM